MPSAPPGTTVSSYSPASTLPSTVSTQKKFNNTTTALVETTPPIETTLLEIPIASVKSTAKDPVLVPVSVADCTPATKPSPIVVDFSKYEEGVTKDKPVAVFYDVYGTRAREARVQLNKCGIDGFDAHVRWDVSWDFRYEFVGSNCKITNLKVVSTATIVMPNWQYTENTVQTDKDLWETFISLLQKHEDDHVEFSRMAADEVHRVLPSIATPNCDGFADLANTTGTDIVDDFAAQDDAYDVRTKHGATQGIFFPEPR